MMKVLTPVRTLHEWEEFVQDSWQEVEAVRLKRSAQLWAITTSILSEKNTWDKEVNYVGEVEFVSLW